MAGTMLGAQNSFPSYFKQGVGEAKLNPTVTSFEKELGQVLSSLKKAEKKWPSWEFHQKVSNALFNVWNSYEAKLPAGYYTAQLLATGDLLYKKGLFQLASVHCYGRYLASLGVQWNDDLVGTLQEKNIDTITATLRATIGDVMCEFYVAEKEDPTMALLSTRAKTLSVLEKLQQVSQVALSREPLYWLVYNALLLTYTLSRTMMKYGYSGLVLEHLLWGAVCMESSVPLMALKYLQLRVNFYVAVCQCYWDTRQPHSAELFARRGLSKVHELAQLEHQSSAQATDSSEIVFKEASIKMGVMVFKRSALESRKKTKSIFRPKVRPTIRDLLQIPSPRSSTEKLLCEMFSGHSAQFLTILEFLSDSSRRPLEQAPPSPITELDNDTVTDVYQELFCIGTELSLHALDEAQREINAATSTIDSADSAQQPTLHHCTSLMSLASKGGGRVPLDAVVRFVRLARSYNQKEVVEILADPTIRVTKLSEDELSQSSGAALELILAIDSLHSAHKKYKSHISAPQGIQPASAVGGPPQGPGGSAHPPHPPPTAGTNTTAAGSTGQQTMGSGAEGGGTAEELFDRLQHVLTLLHSACVDVTNPGRALPLVSMDFDLLLDALIVVWEVARPALARINSHSYNTCRQFLTHSTGNQYLQLLVELVEVSQSLQLWQTDPLLHGELHLKLGCLYEAKAEVKGQNRQGGGGSKTMSNVTLVVEGNFQLYDRKQLLECLSELEVGLQCVQMARAEMMEESKKGVGKEGVEIAVLHSEYMFSIIRVKVKLASTIPPPPSPESTQKLSSLKSKVKEREERQRQREKMLSELTAPTVPVANESQLKEVSGKNQWSTALVLMLEACTTPRLGQEDREKLMKESFSCLLQEQQRLADLEKTTDPTSSARTPSTATAAHLLPPPILQYSTDDSMAFVPPTFSNRKLQDSVAYYKLFGRVASGSNVKVRLTDKHLPGLGIEVPACNCGTEGRVTVKVKGLQANESYVFAVAAYSQSGELVGGSIGATGRPIVACYALSMLMLWGYCCQCAYKAGVGSIASKASAILWKHFVHPQPNDDQTLKEMANDEEEQFELNSLDTPLLSATPTAILRHFIESVIVHTQLSMSEGSLLTNKLCVAGPLKPTQLQRLKLISKLFTAVQVAGMINDPNLCLQAVVLCFGLMAPMVQQGITASPLLEVLLYCHAVLVELPEHVLISAKDSSGTASLHHVIAATAYYVGKVIHTAQRKSLFTSFTTNARGLLLITMQAATNVAKEMEKDKNKEKEATPPPNDGDLHQPSLLPESQDAALVSYATMRSSLGHILPQKVADKKKKGRKKLIAAADQLSDEAKSLEYKAFEAFLMSSHSHHQGMDDLDLTGQEDPAILHAVIANLPSQQAYKEVHKFRRRPQYLEYLVHLCALTIAKGGQERVMGWIQDAFHWLKKRNELLLTPKSQPPKVGGGGGAHAHQKMRTVSARGSATALAQAKTGGRRTSLTTLAPTAASKGHTIIGAKDSKAVLHTSTLREEGFSKVGAGTSKALLAAPSQHGPIAGQQRQQQIGRKPSAMGKRLVPATSRNLDVSLSVKITRDDIEYKAHILVATLLPELWRKHKCRKRLRAVCTEDMPWRSQANLIQATCYLDTLLGRLGHSEVSTDTEPHLHQPHGLTFDAAGVIIDGVLPIHPPVLAGAEAKPQSKGAKVSSSIEVVAINDLQVIMSHLQRAVVLASRGRHWTLLQNAARALWNTINTLLKACSSSKLDEARRETIQAAVYGLAMKPLYFATRGLTELLASLDTADTKPLPTVASLHFTESLDDCNAVGLLFIKQVVYLSIHTLYVHQHWEKMIDIAVNFDDVTQHSWADQFVPVITSAQTKLATRLSQHSRQQPHKKDSNNDDTRKDKLHPAAHLDPGPEGYNIYGKMGHSLALTAVPLDTRLTMDRLKGQGLDEGERALSKARSMLSRYCATEMDQKHKNVNSAKEYPQQTQSDDSSKIECPSMPLTQVSSVVSAYDEAIIKLLKSGKKELTAQAMSELGDVAWHGGHGKTAGHWWREALSTVTGIQDVAPVNGSSKDEGWRKLVESIGGGVALTKFGVWGCLLAAINATKLARYSSCGALDIRLEYTLLSASLFRSLLTYSLPHPTKDLDYISYHLPQSSTGSRLTPGMEVFADVHRCNPLALLSSLQWTAHELILRKHSVKVLPVLWLYHHLSHMVCRDITHTVMARLLKVQALTQLSLFDHAFLCLSDLLTGVGLPSTTTDHDRLVESHWTPLKFNIGAPSTDPKNIKCLQHVMERGLTSRLKQLYGRELVSLIGLARAQLYTSLAVTTTHVPAPISSRSSAGKSTSAPRPPTNLSTITGSPKSSAPSSPGSTRPPDQTNSSMAKRIKSDIKLMLLTHAEKELFTVCSESATGSEIKTRSYLAMAEVALALYQPSTAVQLCMAALRNLQSTNKDADLSNSQELDENLKNLGLNCRSSFEADLRLWLECKNILAKSLVDAWCEPLNCASVCGEGCEECEACGDVEMWAEFHLTAAVHALSVDLPNLDLLQTHTQNGLELLNSLHELTPHAQLLSTKLSLMLSDASCLQSSTVLEEMVPVYHGLTEMLNNQMAELLNGCSSINIYQPHRALLASCKLRLAHTLTLMVSSTTPNDRGDLITSAMAACEDGLQLLKDSTHTNPPLEVELVFQYGILCGLQSTDGDSFNFTPLFEAAKILSSQGLNYRLLFTSFCELANLYSTSSKRLKPPFKTPKTPKTPGSTDTPTSLQKSLKSPTSVTSSDQEPTQRAPSPRRPSVSRMSSKPPSQEQDRVSKAEREWNKERVRESYLAWCMIKCAMQSLSTSQQLIVLASELHNEEVTKKLNDKMLDDLPDFVLLDLCPSENLLQTLVTNVHQGRAPPIEVMLPSTQHADTSGLTWFKIIGYFHNLLQHCFWQKNALGVTASPWLLHYSELTPSSYSKSKSLLNFLLQHCPPFKSCRLPSPPPLLSLSQTGQRQSGGAQSAAIQQADAYLSAADYELNVVWTSPFLSPLVADKSTKNGEKESGATEGAKISESKEKNEKSEEGKISNDIIIGYFALNQKAVRTSMPSHLTSFGFESYIVKIPSEKLSELHSTWQDLAATSKAVLVESRSSSRPLSRSPSKQKKMEKPFRVPPELVESLELAVINLAEALGSKLTRERIPKLELQNVSAVAQVLRPYSEATVKGEAYHFFKSLFDLS